MKYKIIQNLDDMLKRESINEITIKETETKKSFSSVRYSLFLNDRLVESFEDDNHDFSQIEAAYSYFLGFIDCYLIQKRAHKIGVNI